MFDLTGKTALVTGASGGLGGAIARTLHGQGAAVVLSGTRADFGSHAARTIAAALIGLWSFAAGLLGIVLTLLWTVTDHIFAHGNENLLLFNPLWLALAMRMRRLKARS